MESDSDTRISRRGFLFATAAALMTGCQSIVEQQNAGRGSAEAGPRERVVDAGPVSRYAADGVYDEFRDQGFFLIRKGDKLVALSSYCTHRKCKLTTDPDRSLYCPCHGSTFSPDGKVTEGPAKRSLPTLSSFTDGTGELFVRVHNL